MVKTLNLNSKFPASLAGGQIKNSRGFTIIEMLVVVAIITLLPMVALTNFSRARLQFSLSRTAYRFAQDIRSIQDKAVSAAPFYDQFGVAKLVAGYGVHVSIADLGGQAYRLYADNNSTSANFAYDAADYLVSDVDFSQTEPGIVIKEVKNVTNNTASINFSPPAPRTIITQLGEGQNKVEVVFAFAADLNTTKTVSISTTGLIEIQ